MTVGSPRVHSVVVVVVLVVVVVVVVAPPEQQHKLEHVVPLFGIDVSPALHEPVLHAPLEYPCEMHLLLHVCSVVVVVLVVVVVVVVVVPPEQQHLCDAEHPSWPALNSLPEHKNLHVPIL